MPIRPEMKARYPKDWPAISRRIRFERAGGRCEKCGAPHGETIFRSADNVFYILPDGSTFLSQSGHKVGRTRGSEMPSGRYVRVILTVAHIDHRPENCADENLLALCQLHHLRMDAKLHRLNAHTTRRRRKASGDLFDECP